MRRTHWSDRIRQLDPEVDHAEVYRITSAHEFPWDVNQALGFALFRTYAVPSIGALLDRTGEFTERVAKRYDDTALLLGAVVEHGPDSLQGRTAVKRINQMHGAYDISNDDLRYVLCTFVVMPIRWLDAYGWRPMSEAEKVASAHYYRRLGALMGIREVPATWQDFDAALEAYEREHFARDPGARRVADATLALLATQWPNSWLPAWLVRRTSYALMDPPLLQALGYPRQHRSVERLVRGALRLRGRVVRLLPPRLEPFHARDLKTLTTWVPGTDLATLGTFPACPVDRRAEA